MYECWHCSYSSAEVRRRLSLLAKLASGLEIYTYVCPQQKILLHQLELVRSMPRALAQGKLHLQIFQHETLVLPALQTAVSRLIKEGVTLRSVQFNWLTAAHNTNLVSLFSACARELRLYLSVDVGEAFAVDLHLIEVLELNLEALWPISFLNKHGSPLRELKMASLPEFRGKMEAATKEARLEAVLATLRAHAEEGWAPGAHPLALYCDTDSLVACLEMASELTADGVCRLGTLTIRYRKREIFTEEELEALGVRMAGLFSLVRAHTRRADPKLRRRLLVQALNIRLRAGSNFKLKGRVPIKGRQIKFDLIGREDSRLVVPIELLIGR